MSHNIDLNVMNMRTDLAIDEVNNEEANKKIDKALNSGIITKNKAARQKSRIAKKLNNNN